MSKGRRTRTKGLDVDEIARRIEGQEGKEGRKE